MIFARCAWSLEEWADFTRDIISLLKIILLRNIIHFLLEQKAAQRFTLAPSAACGVRWRCCNSGMLYRLGWFSPNLSILCAQVRRVLASGRTQSMASSYFRECRNLPAKAANSLSQVV